MQNNRRYVVWLATLTFVGCGSPSARRPPSDAGAPDAGVSDVADAGDLDAGVELTDAGPTDSGVDDAGTDDAGTDDAGTADAGSSADGGDDAGPSDAGVAPSARLRLEEIANAYRAFYAAELRWPRAASFWDPRTTDVSPTAGTIGDTALFAAPTSLPVCQTGTHGLCWHGPFLEGSSLGAAPWLDPWGQPIRYALMGVDAGLSAAPQGAIVLWSIGPDGIDQTGCTTLGSTPGCVVNRSLLAQGQPSLIASDDVALVISPAFDPVTSTQLLTEAVGDAYQSFHDDTGLWPFSSCGWDPMAGASPQIDPFYFSMADDVLTTQPDATNCSPDVGLYTPMSWQGPYVWSDVANLGSGAAVDGWGNPLLSALIRPFDGYGGGVASAPKGAILVWSMGPDGIDQTGCSQAMCAVNYSLLVQGLPSVPGADDIIVRVDTAISE